MAAAMVITLAMTYIQQTCGLPGDIWATWAPDRVDGDEPSSRVAFSPLVFLSGLVWTFIAALLRLALCRRTYFVDGSCINQVDPEKKLLGIRSIGGFLSLSSQFIVLWDEQYFTRLWCVYELAVFRALNPRRPVLFLPMRFCFAAAVGYFVVLFAVTGVAGLSCRPIFFGDDLDAIVGSPLFYPALVVFWVSAFACCLMTVILGATLERQRSLLQEQLESFDARQGPRPIPPSLGCLFKAVGPGGGRPSRGDPRDSSTPRLDDRKLEGAPRHVKCKARCAAGQGRRRRHQEREKRKISLSPRHLISLISRRRRRPERYRWATSKSRWVSMTPAASHIPEGRRTSRPVRGRIGPI